MVFVRNAVPDEVNGKCVTSDSQRLTLEKLKYALLQLVVVIATHYRSNPQRYTDCIEAYYERDVKKAKVLALSIVFDVLTNWVLIMLCQPKGGIAND